MKGSGRQLVRGSGRELVDESGPSRPASVRFVISTLLPPLDTFNAACGLSRRLKLGWRIAEDIASSLVFVAELRGWCQRHVGHTSILHSYLFLKLVAFRSQILVTKFKVRGMQHLGVSCI